MAHGGAAEDVEHVVGLSYFARAEGMISSMRDAALPDYGDVLHFMEQWEQGTRRVLRTPVEERERG